LFENFNTNKTCPATPLSEKFKILHGFYNTLTTLFILGAFLPAIGRQKPRFPLQFGR
jgi:hypothetical protein